MGKCHICRSACLEDTRTVASAVEEQFPKLQSRVKFYPIGAATGSHNGPGTLALFFWGDKREDWWEPVWILRLWWIQTAGLLLQSHKDWEYMYFQCLLPLMIIAICKASIFKWNSCMKRWKENGNLHFTAFSRQYRGNVDFHFRGLWWNHTHS